jgi:hypothetical protein
MLLGIDLHLTDAQFWQEYDIKQNGQPAPSDVVPLNRPQRFIVAKTGKVVEVKDMIWRGSPLRGTVECLAYWLQEVTDEPSPYFTKTVEEVDRLIKEGRLRCT